MDMIIFPVTFDELRVKVPAYVFENLRKDSQRFGVENSTAILGHEDQMYVKLKNAVPTPPDFLICCHRPML